MVSNAGHSFHAVPGLVPILAALLSSSLCGTDLATVLPDFRLWGWACCSRNGLTATVLGLEAGSLSHGDFSKVNRIIQDGVGRFILGFRKEVGGRGT